MSHPDMPEEISRYTVPREAITADPEVVAAMREEMANPKPGSIIDKFAAIRVASGDAWNKVDDPEKFLGREPQISQEAAMELLDACVNAIKDAQERDEDLGYMDWPNMIAAIAHARADLGPDPVCEHGVKEGDYCEPCNREYKRSQKENV